MLQSEISRFERRKLLVLQVLLLLTVIAGVVCFVWFRGTSADGEGLQKKTREQYVNPKDSLFMRSNAADYNDAIPIEQAESLLFDPNTADSTLLRRIGLSTYQIRNLYKYRARRGVFHRPDDFKKLHGLTVQQWKHLQPLIRISEAYQYLADTPDAYRPAKGFAGSRQRNETAVGEERDPQQIIGQRIPRDTTLYPYKLHEGETVELNLADTTQLKRIPGIGSYFARKIVQYRERLGGFISVSQLDEIENLPLGIEPYLTLTPAPVKKVLLNKSTFRQLNAHPYINYYQAQTIIDHLRQVGPIHSLQDLSLYDEFPDADLQRLAPYVDFSE